MAEPKFKTGDVLIAVHEYAAPGYTPIPLHSVVVVKRFFPHGWVEVSPCHLGSYDFQASQFMRLCDFEVLTAVEKVLYGIE